MQFFHPERCTRAWSKQSVCSLCVTACPVGALSLDDGRVVVDGSVCVMCGVCAAACPLEAFEVGIGYREILQQVSGQAEVLFSCRALGEGEVRVPCLGFLDRALLYALAAEGIALRLDVTCCQTCPVRPGLVGLTHALNEVQATLSQNGHAWDATLVTIQPGIPPELSRRPPATHPAEPPLPRRGVPEKVVLLAKALRRILMPFSHPPPRSSPASVGMEEEATGVKSEVVWSHPTFDPEKCTVCGVCAASCPTGALMMEEGLGTLLLRLSDCAACQICVDTCADGALAAGNRAPARWLMQEVILGSVPVKYCRRCARTYPARAGGCPACDRFRDMLKAFYACLS